MIFAIWSPRYNGASGGIMSLHKLGNVLLELGHRVYIIARDKADWSRAALTPNLNNIRHLDPIVIYPEIVRGNPLRGRRVVRWLLNTPGVCGGDGIYAWDDRIFLWHPSYQSDKTFPALGLLHAKDFHLDYFRDQGKKRAGCCHAFHKYRGIDRKQHPKNSVCIDEPRAWRGPRAGGNQYLLKIFNQTGRFYCYDLKTQLGVIAALCGCETVFVPDPAITLQQWIADWGREAYGCAYGAKDLPRAKATLPLLRPALAEIEKESVQTVRAFVSQLGDWQ